MYEMLTGRRPPHRGAAAASASNSHVPAELDGVVLKAVAPNPDSRYQSAATFAAELRSVAAILDVRGTRADDDEDEADVPAHGAGRALVLAIVMMAILAAIAWWVLR
jgi:hypothetical protein